jgi:ribosomal protein L35
VLPVRARSASRHAVSGRRQQRQRRARPGSARPRGPRARLTRRAPRRAQLCRQFEEAFAKSVDGGKGGGEQILTVFERRLSENIRQLEFRKILEPQNVKRIVEEADGYQPHLIAPEMGYRRLLQARPRDRPRLARARRRVVAARPGPGGAGCGGRSGRRPAQQACAVMAVGACMSP